MREGRILLYFVAVCVNGTKQFLYVHNEYEKTILSRTDNAFLSPRKKVKLHIKNLKLKYYKSDALQRSAIAAVPYRRVM